MRVYELAKQLGVSSRDVLLAIEELGVGGKTASSSVPPTHLAAIRTRFRAAAAPETETPPSPPVTKVKAPPAAEKVSKVAPPAAAVPAEAAPQAGDRIKLKVPITAADFAAALDTDADNVMHEASSLGETLGENDSISAELAVLIGEQWGYSIEVEEPEVVAEAAPEERAEEVVAVAVEEPRVSEVEAEAVAAEEPAAPEPMLRVVPRRVAPPDAPPRAPVVTVMGHVDHGKTTLLDAIRETKVTAQEAGAITQHIGAYQVEVRGHAITFIDTPGHAAFTAMRARGAQVTDIVVLVVAADDGVMPQTLEAIDHAQAAGVPIVVAVNKSDLPTANMDAVKQKLSERNLVPEEWGGDTIYTPVSALRKEGIDNLLEVIILVAEMNEPRAVRDKPAEGAVLEAELDRRRGCVATLLVQEGTLRTGDSIVVGPVAGKVRAMTDDRGRRLTEAGPSVPARVIGLSAVPEASELFRVVASDREARALADAQKQTERDAGLASTATATMVDLSQLFATGEAKLLNMVLKGDVQGSVEAIESSLKQMGTSEVQIAVLHAGVGEVTESDVSLAAASKPTVIIGFQVGADTQARRLAADERLEIRRYDVIYELLDDVRMTMSGMLEAIYEEVVVGSAEVRALFRSSRAGAIAGCYVLDGRMVRGATVRVRRQGEVLYEGRLDSLRHIKEDAGEISQGFECGISLSGFNDFEPGDVVECIQQREVKRTLS